MGLLCSAVLVQGGMEGVRALQEGDVRRVSHPPKHNLTTKVIFGVNKARCAHELCPGHACVHDTWSRQATSVRSNTRLCHNGMLQEPKTRV